MSSTIAAIITNAQRALVILLAEWEVPGAERKAADAVTLLVRHGLRPTSARTALPVSYRRGTADPSIAHRGAAGARRLLAARRQECE
ncbi:hypothetical protein AB0F17_47435 [Nonomuraea sp. NPDC026600]|uniref:hypothetical protein n=1 Tax=Nonomuraea sp. NPDC026600 TaxID=3155363 RepID=UPI0033EC716C